MRFSRETSPHRVRSIHLTNPAVNQRILLALLMRKVDKWGTEVADVRERHDGVVRPARMPVNPPQQKGRH